MKNKTDYTKKHKFEYYITAKRDKEICICGLPEDDQLHGEKPMKNKCFWHGSNTLCTYCDQMVESETLEERLEKLEKELKEHKKNHTMIMED
jgi:hypothetical protein